MNRARTTLTLAFAGLARRRGRYQAPNVVLMLADNVGCGDRSRDD